MQPLNPTDVQNPRSVKAMPAETMTIEKTDGDRVTAETPKPARGRSAVGYVIALALAAALIAGAVFFWQSGAGTTAEEPAGNAVEADVSAPIDPIVPGP